MTGNTCTVIVVQPTLTHEPPRAFEADRGMGRSYCKQHTGDEPRWQLFQHADLPGGISGGSFEQTFSHSGGTRNDEQSHVSRGVPLGFSSV